MKKREAVRVFSLGCPSGFEPEITDPQTVVLPLHYGHHIATIGGAFGYTKKDR